MNLRQKRKAINKAFRRLGLSGRFDLLVEMISKKDASLTNNEIKFVRPLIIEESKRRWDHWVEVCIKHLGEDSPGDWQLDENILRRKNANNKKN